MNLPLVEIWLIAGLAFILVELTLISGIGFLFLGFGALTTSIFIHFYPCITDYQIAVFGLLSLVWFIILWVPLKKFAYSKRFSKGKGEYFDLIGAEVAVFNLKIEPKEIGQVTWSGTIMNARLDPSEKEDVYKGEILRVLDIQGNILICGRKKS